MFPIQSASPRRAKVLVRQFPSESVFPVRRKSLISSGHLPSFAGVLFLACMASCGRSELAPNSHANMISPANALEAVLVATAADIEQKPELERELLSSTVYLKVTLGTLASIEAGDHRIAFYKVPLSDGTYAAALYTSKNRLGEVHGIGAPFVAMTGQSALEFVSGLPVALNPGLQPSAVWSAAEVAKLGQGTTGNENQHGKTNQGG